jgi:hypothetical protein
MPLEPVPHVDDTPAGKETERDAVDKDDPDSEESARDPDETDE